MIIDLRNSYTPELIDNNSILTIENSLPNTPNSSQYKEFIKLRSIRIKESFIIYIKSPLVNTS